MPTNKLYGVITTIQEPTACMEELAKVLRLENCPLLVIGDKKGPSRYDLEGCRLWTLDAQLELPFDLARLLPTGSYARKNLGYLLAMSEGADCIYETDDDNRPLPTWQIRKAVVNAHTVGERGWFNVFRYFRDDAIWPRGFALAEIRRSLPVTKYDGQLRAIEAPLQQGLVNGSPDVDAIWRLAMEHEFSFEDKPSIHLPAGVWCPFNSQSTWWWPQAYALMYLPSHCTFRMTDIWRGFIALRCLWALGHGIVFHAPEVYQDRNLHNLMKDFEHEVPGYLQNQSICEWLEEVELREDQDALPDNLRCCYERLISKGVFPRQELDLVEAWLEAVETAAKPWQSSKLAKYC